MLGQLSYDFLQKINPHENTNEATPILLFHRSIGRNFSRIMQK